MKTQTRRNAKRAPTVERAEKAADPVCGMEVETSTDFFSFYKDHVYYFCSPEDKAEFDRRPEDFIKRDKTPDIHGAVVEE